MLVKKGIIAFGSPWYTQCPLARTYIWSKFLKIVADGWWMVHTTVLPLLARFFSSWMHCDAVTSSKPLVGSSRKNIVGFATDSRAMERRFLSPPLRHSAVAFRRWFRLRFSRISVIRTSWDFRDVTLRAHATCMSSSTVRRGWWWSSCVM